MVRRSGKMVDYAHPSGSPDGRLPVPAPEHTSDCHVSRATYTRAHASSACLLICNARQLIIQLGAVRMVLKARFGLMPAAAGCKEEYGTLLGAA